MPFLFKVWMLAPNVPLCTATNGRSMSLKKCNHQEYMDWMCWETRVNGQVIEGASFKLWHTLTWTCACTLLCRNVPQTLWSPSSHARLVLFQGFLQWAMLISKHMNDTSHCMWMYVESCLAQYITINVLWCMLILSAAQSPLLTWGKPKPKKKTCRRLQKRRRLVLHGGERNTSSRFFSAMFFLKIVVFEEFSHTNTLFSKVHQIEQKNEMSEKMCRFRSWKFGFCFPVSRALKTWRFSFGGGFAPNGRTHLITTALLHFFLCVLIWKWNTTRALRGNG